MHYVVTGGLGFIGTHLVNALVQKGHSVHIVDDLSTGVQCTLPEGVTLTIADITTAGVMHDALKGADGCFHLAAVASVERCKKAWKETSAINVVGTIAVFEAAKAQPTPLPVVYASSAAVYGAEGELLTEATPTHPISSYGVDKLACEAYARIAWECYRLPNVGLRLFNVYGPGQRSDNVYSSVITLFVNAALHNAPITVFGDGQQTRDFVMVDDAVHALLAAMRHPMEGAAIYNVCSGRSTSLNQLIEYISSATRTQLSPSYAEARIGDIRHSLGSPAALNAAFSLPPQAGIAAGLKRTIFALEHARATPD